MKEVENIISYPRKERTVTPKFHFRLGMWKKIENRKFWNKPNGGFWGSPENSERGWSWFVDSGMSGWDLRYPTKYRLRKGAKVYIINSPTDLDKFPGKHHEYLGDKYYNFKGLLKKFGYDAIWLTEEGERMTRYYTSPDNTFGFYGWDVESVLALNKDVIVYPEISGLSSIPRKLQGIKLISSAGLVFDGSRWRHPKEVSDWNAIEEQQDLGKFRSRKALIRYLISLRYYVGATAFEVLSAENQKLCMIQYRWPTK